MWRITAFGCAPFGFDHHPGTLPTAPASKVTPSGAATCSMMASKGTRAAVPRKRPLLGSTMARNPAIAVLSSLLMGWNAVALCCAKRWSSRDVGIRFLLCVGRSCHTALLTRLGLGVAVAYELATSLRSNFARYLPG